MEPITYKGIAITINNGGKFVAKIDELSFEKPSLAAMKKLIDNKEKDKFQPFTALVEIVYRWGNHIKPNIKGADLARVTCIRIKDNGRKSWRRRKSYVMTAAGVQQEFETCYLDKPEVIEHFREKKKAERDLEAAKEKATKSLDKIDDALRAFMFDTEF